MTTGLKDLVNHAAEARRLLSMSELLADLAHHINQPLAAIAAYAQGSAQQLRANTANPEDLLQASEQITAEALRAGEVVRLLRERIRAAGGRETAVDIGALVAEVMRALQPEAQRRDVPVRLDTRASTPPVLCYAQGLARAVSTLVSRCTDTAASHADYERVLRVRVAPSTDPQAVEISVAIGGYDPSVPTGDVLPESVPSGAACLAAEIAVVRSLVESHGGRLWVVAESRGLCSARLTLPAERL